MNRFAPIALVLLASCAHAQGVKLGDTTPLALTSGQGQELTFSDVLASEGNPDILPGGGVRISVPGWYLVGVRVTFADSHNGQRSVSVAVYRDNSGIPGPGVWEETTNHYGPILEASEPMLLQPGDLVLGRAFQNSGHSLDVGERRLWVVLIRPVS